MKSLYRVLFFLFISVNLYGQLVFSKSSSTSGTSVSDYAIDGNKVGHSATTQNELNPYIDVYLSSNSTLSEIEIWFDENIHGTTLNNFYLISSKTPFGNDLTSNITNNPYVHITGGISNGSSIPVLEEFQYLRLQLAYEGVLSIKEVYGEFGGGTGHDGEDGSDNWLSCNDGIDNSEGDGSDCLDSDCMPEIANINIINPSCAVCYDGAIHAQIFGPPELQYSVNGGPWIDYCYNVTDCITGLTEGTYSIMVRSAVTGCIYGPVDITLTAPVGSQTSDCDNGGLENGDWENWQARRGDITIQNGNVQITWEDNSFIPVPVPSNRFQIRTNGFVDPNVDLDFLNPNPTGGSFFAQIGNDLTSNSFPTRGGFERNVLEYCFDVDDSNKDFQFFFALVLQNPLDQNHGPEDQPFFEWTLRDSEGTSFMTETEMADVNDSFFQVSNIGFEDEPILYKGWTCRSIDLNSYIGQEVCFEFTVADCSQGGHFGYAYIDGLCDDNNIEAIVDGNDIYCLNQDIIVSGARSKGYDQYRWTICEVVNNQAQDCKSSGFQFGFDVPDLVDVLGLYQELSGGPSASCDITLRVILDVKSEECGESNNSKDFILSCSDDDINYYDILDCVFADQQNIQIEGENNCSSCTYQWTASPREEQTGDFLSNPLAEYPIITGELNVLALSQEYKVSAINDLGCEFTDVVNIYSIEELSGEVELYEEKTICKSEIFANISLSSPLNSNSISVQFKDELNNETFIGVPVEPNLLSNTHIFRIDESLPRNIDRQFSAIVVAFNLDIDNFIVNGESCRIETNDDLLTTKSQYIGEIAWWIPNIFSPNGDDQNDTFGPCMAGCTCYDPCPTNNLTWAQMKIFNRAGGLLHFVELVATENNPIVITDLNWDGNVNGIPVQPGVYVYLVDFENCDEARRCSDCDESDLIDDPQLDNCGAAGRCKSKREGYNRGWYSNYGDVTVVR